MRFLRNLLDKQGKLFAKGTKLERLHPLHEAGDTFFFTPGEVTNNASHVRDALDIKRTMMVVVVFFALSLAQVRRAHLRVEVVYNYMPKPVKFIADILQYALSCIFFALIAYFGWKLAVLGYHQGEYASGIINFAIWPARFALSIGASLMTLQCALDLVGCILGWPLHEDAHKPAPKL